MKWPLWVLAVLFFTGYAGIGPGTVTRDRFDYTTALSDSWKHQMLVKFFSFLMFIFTLVETRDKGTAPIVTVSTG